MPHEPGDPMAVAEKIGGWTRAWRLDTRGSRLLSASNGRALAQLRVTPELLPPTTDAAAIIALGNATALAASASALDPSGELDPTGFPQTVQLSVNLFRGTGQGTITAEAQLTYRTRTTLIVEVKVRNEERQLIASLAVTQLTSRPAGAEAPLRRAS